MLFLPAVCSNFYASQKTNMLALFTLEKVENQEAKPLKSLVKGKINPNLKKAITKIRNQ